MHADAELRSPIDANDVMQRVVADDQIAYSVPHAAKVIDLGERTVWQLVQSGEIESFKIGTSRRIMRSALVDYLKVQIAKAAA